MFVPAGDDADLGEPAGEPAVLFVTEVRNRHDGVGLLAMEGRNRTLGRRHRIEELQAAALVAADFLAHEAQTEEPDFQRAECFHQMRRCTAHRTPGGGVEHVRDHVLKSRLAHPGEEHVLAEVEFVIAQRGEIEVERLDHLPAFEDARRDRRREEVAGDDQERGRAAPGDVLLQRGHARQSAKTADRRGLVDIVDLKNGELCALLKRVRFLGGRGRVQEADGGQNRDKDPRAHDGPGT